VLITGENGLIDAQCCRVDSQNSNVGGHLIANCNTAKKIPRRILSYSIRKYMTSRCCNIVRCI